MLVAALLVSLAASEANAAAWFGHHPLRPSFPFSEPQHQQNNPSFPFSEPQQNNPSFPFSEQQQQNNPIFEYGRAGGPFLQEDIRVEQDAGNFYISPDEEQVHIEREEEPSKDYSGWTVLKVEGIGRSHVAPFHSLHDLHERADVSVLHENRVEGFAHVAAAPSIREALIRDMMGRGLRVTDLNQDIGRLIENNKSSFRAELPKGQATFDRFMKYEEIMAFVDRVALDNPTLVKKSSIGKSVEGRDIIMLAITSSDKLNRLGREMDDRETLDILAKLAKKTAEEKHAAALRQQEAIRRKAMGKDSAISPQADPTKGFETYDLTSGYETAKSNDEVAARNSINEIEEDVTRYNAIEMTIKVLRNLITSNRDGRQISAVESELPRKKKMGEISPEGLAMLQEIESRSSDNLNSIMTLLQSLMARNSTASFKSTPAKPIIFIDGGIHAREWVSPASLVYFVEQLVAPGAESRELLGAVEWRIIPVLNPDGYVYSHDKDRLWRKNRAQNAFFRACRGVDLNRNFGFKWGGAGTSASSCSQIFRGARAFSEPESTALKNAITDSKVLSRVKAYITVHSYGQMILHPWGYTRNPLHHDHDKLTSFGNQMAEAINRVHGSVFEVGSAAGVLYAAAGGSDDYVSNLGVPYSYTFELRDKGTYGFELDPSLIRATVEETWAAMVVLGKKIKTDYFLRSDSNNVSQRKVEKSGISENNETNNSDITRTAIPIMIRNDDPSQDKVKSILNNLATVLASGSLPNVGNGSQMYLLPPTHYIMFGRLGEKPTNNLVRATGNQSDTESNQVPPKLSSAIESNQVYHKLPTSNESTLTTDSTTLNESTTTPYWKTTTTESSTTSQDLSSVFTDLIRSIHAVGNVTLKANSMLDGKPMDIHEVIRPSGLVEDPHANATDIEELVRPSGLVEPSGSFNPSDLIRPA